MLVAEMIADFSEHVFVQLPSLSPDVQLGWQNYVKYIYEHSPAVRAHFADNGIWYSRELIQLLTGQIQQDHRPLVSAHDA